MNFSHDTATFLGGCHFYYNQYEKNMLGIFVYLFIYKVKTAKVNFRF